MFGSALAGFFTGMSLIVAIGAQNAFLLRLGLIRTFVLPVVLICTLSDALLICAGIGGMGALITKHHTALVIATYAGAAFLLFYGIRSLISAAKAGSLTAASAAPTSLGATLLTTLAFTYLNPHVYLDTVLMVGTIGASHGDLRWWFALGACLASAVWFFSLGFGARHLQRFFARAASWRILDVAIGVLMIGLSAKLVLG